MVIIPLITVNDPFSQPVFGPACLVGQPCQNLAGSTSTWLLAIILWTLTGTGPIIAALFMRVVGTRWILELGAALVTFSSVYFVGLAAFLLEGISRPFIVSASLVLVVGMVLSIGPLLAISGGFIAIAIATHGAIPSS